MFLGRGDEVVGVDNFDGFYPEVLKQRNLEGAGGDSRFEFRRCDFRSLQSGDLESFDSVVHLAARAGVRASFADPKMYSEVNAGGTEIFAERAARAGVGRFVLSSSSSVYGNAICPTSERSPTDPLSPYATSKLAAEEVCARVASQKGLDVVVLRFFSVYGPRQRPDQAIAKFTRLLVEAGQLTLFGDGTSRRDYTFVGDVVRAIKSAVDLDVKPSETFRVYNVGAGEPVTLIALVELLSELTGSRGRVRQGGAQRGDADQTCADFALIRNELGWEPEVSLRMGVSIFVDWYRKTYGYTKPAIS